MASRAEWQRRVTQWKKSGLTAEVFAAQQGLHPGTLRWWSSALRRPAAAPGAEIGFARLVAADAEPSASAEPAALELVLPSGRIVRVRRGFDPALLRELLAVVEAS
jgi:transposase